MLCYAGTSTDRAQQTLDVIIAEIRRLGREGIEPEELETMRAGLKSSLIMAQESSMSRSSARGLGLVLLGPGPPARGDRDRAGRPDSAVGLGLCRRIRAHARLTILTLGPTALKFPVESEV